MFLSLANLVWAAFPGPGAEPKFTERRETVKTLKVENGDTISIANQFGDVDVNAAQPGEVKVHAELIAGADSKACAESCLQHLSLDTRRQGHRLIISSTTEPGCCSATQFQTNLTVSVPEPAVVSIENSYGDITVTGVQGMVTANNRFGGTNLHGVRFAKVTNDFGDVNLDRMQGLTVKNRVGNVTAHDITGPIRITNETGAIRLIRTNGPTQLDNKLGEVVVTAGQGRIRITNSQGPVTFEQARPGPDTVSIAGSNSAIRLDLPAQPSAMVNARVSRGSIVCSQAPKDRAVTDGFDSVENYSFGPCAGRFDLESVGAGIVIDLKQER